MNANSVLAATALLAGSLVVPGAAPAQQAGAAAPLRIAWRDNMLGIRSPALPGGELKIWYLEAFCRSRSTDRDWSETVIPFRTTELEASPDGSRIRLKSVVEPGVTVMHDIRAGRDEVDFRLTLHNPTAHDVDIQWAQPCIRARTFTGLSQKEYIRKCFIYTKDGLRTLDQTHRTEEARYRGGQVYVPAGVDRRDVNPRPISPDVPVNGLIGCYSADGDRIVATAWDQVQELFQGVIVCIHSDFHIGGLKAGETKRLHGKLYLMENDPAKLLVRYKKDFGR